MDDNKIKTIELVSALKNGSEDAYNELYKMYYDQMFKIAMMNIETSGNKNVQTAEDIVQESMLKAYQKIDTLKDNSNFAGWLCTIVKNKCRDFFDKAYVKHESLFTDEEKTNDKGEKVEVDTEDERIIYKPDALLNEDTKNEMLHDILNSLSEEQKVVTIMYYFDDFSKQEIADTLGIKVTTVDGRLSTARKNIEKGVLSLEKKQGIKLYNVAAIPAIPFFLYLLGKAEISEDKIGQAALHTATKHFANEATKEETTTKSAKESSTSESSIKNNSASKINTPKPSFSKKAIIGLIAGACVIGGGAAVAINKATSYKTFDAFSLIESVDFTGINGYGTVTASCKDGEACTYNGAELTFSFDKATGLSNDDTVTLSVNIDDEKQFAEEHGGYVPEEVSKTYTVEHLYEYITSPDDIPDEILSYFDEFIKIGCSDPMNKLNQIHDDDNYYIGYYNLEYVGNFVQTPIDSSETWHNELDLVYKIDAEGQHLSSYLDSSSGSFYIVFEFLDVSLNDIHNDRDEGVAYNTLDSGFKEIVPYDIASKAAYNFEATCKSMFVDFSKAYYVNRTLDDVKSYFGSNPNKNCIFTF